MAAGWSGGGVLGGASCWILAPHEGFCQARRVLRVCRIGVLELV